MRTVTFKFTGKGSEMMIYQLAKEANPEYVASIINEYEDRYEELEEDGFMGDKVDSKVFLFNDMSLVDIEDDTDYFPMKGKYLKTKDYLSQIVEPTNYVQLGFESEYEAMYTIELADDEGFDPEKIQLVKSDYEIELLPWGIITDFIYYDGKKVMAKEVNHLIDVDVFGMGDEACVMKDKFLMYTSRLI